MLFADAIYPLIVMPQIRCSGLQSSATGEPGTQAQGAVVCTSGEISFIVVTIMVLLSLNV